MARSPRLPINTDFRREARPDGGDVFNPFEGETRLERRLREFEESDEGKKQIEKLNKERDRLFEEEKKDIERRQQEALAQIEEYSRVFDERGEIKANIISDRDDQVAFRKELTDLGFDPEQVRDIRGIKPGQRPELDEAVPGIPAGDVTTGGVTTPSTFQGRPERQRGIELTRQEQFQVVGDTLKDWFFTGEHEVRPAFFKEGDTFPVRGIQSKVIIELVERLKELPATIFATTVPTVITLLKEFDDFANKKTGDADTEMFIGDFKVGDFAKTEIDLGFDFNRLGIPFDARLDPSRIGLNETTLGKDADGKVPDLFTRALDRITDLDEENPESPNSNAFIGLLDTVGFDAFNAWIAGDLNRLTFKAAFPNASRSVIFRGAARGLGIESWLKLTPKEAAKISFNEYLQVSREAYEVRVKSILRGKAFSTVDEAAEIQRLVDEGVLLEDAVARYMAENKLSPRQIVDLARVNVASQQMNIAVNGLKGIPGKVPPGFTYLQELSVIMNAPLTNMKDFKAVIEAIKQSRRKALTTDFIPRQPHIPRIGLQIEPLEPLGGKFLKKSEDIVKEAKFGGVPEEVIIVDPVGETVIFDLGNAGDFDIAISDVIALVTKIVTNHNVTGFIDTGKGETPVYVRKSDKDRLAAIEDETARLQQQRKIDDAVIARRDTELIEETGFIGEASVDDIFANLTGSGESTARQLELLKQVGQVSRTGSDTNKALEAFFRSVKNTQSGAVIPRRALAAKTPITRAIEGSDTIASLAVLARKLGSAAAFAERFNFLTGPARQEIAESAIFKSVQSASAEARRIKADGILAKEVVDAAFKARIPANIVSIPPVERLKLRELDEIAAGLGKSADADLALDLVSAKGLDNVTRTEFLAQRTDKPNTPVFALTDDLEAILLNQDAATREQVAAAIFAGEKFIPSIVLDQSGVIPEIQNLLKARTGPKTLKEFAEQAIDIAPLQKPTAKRSPDVAERIRLNKLVSSGKAVQLGTGEPIWTVIIPSKFVRGTLPAKEPIMSTGLIARDYFDIPKLPVIGAELGQPKAAGSNTLPLSADMNSFANKNDFVQGMLKDRMVDEGFSPALDARMKEVVNLGLMDKKIGKVGDYVEDPILRDAFRDVLDIDLHLAARMSSGEPVDGLGGGVTFGRFNEKQESFIPWMRTDKRITLNASMGGINIRSTLSHEMIHALRDLRGRGFKFDLPYRERVHEMSAFKGGKFWKTNFGGKADKKTAFSKTELEQLWDDAHLPNKSVAETGVSILEAQAGVVTFALGKQAQLIVANSPAGLNQLNSILNNVAQTKGLVPKMFLGGDNFAVVERLKAPDLANRKNLEQFQDAVFDAMEEAAIEGEFAVEEFRDQFIDTLIRTDNFLTNPIPYDFEAMLAFDFDLESILSISSWGQRADGTLTLRNGTYLDRTLREFNFFASATEQLNLDLAFRKLRNRSGKTKKAMKDFDPLRNMAFVPVPVIEEGEDGAEFDPWTSIWATAFAGMARGKGGKRWIKKKPFSKPVAPGLPQPKPLKKLPPGLVGKTILNSDPFLAKTGEPFGGITYIGDLTRTSTPEQEVLGGFFKDYKPLGEGNYSFFDRDDAVAFGKIDFRASSSDNPLVLKTDDDLMNVAQKAGVLDITLSQKADVERLRTYIEKTLGHDGVVIAADIRIGRTAILSNVFETNQLIAFNPKNSIKVNDPLIRQKKIQKDIVRMVDPPANPVVTDEMTLLKRQLKTFGKGVAVGRKLGAAETRKHITATLRNSFMITTDKILRKHELQRLKDRIWEHEREQLRIDLKDYVKALLPAKARGAFIDRIVNTRTRKQFAKVLGQIDKAIEKIERKRLVQEIKDLVGSTVENANVSSDYRRAAKALMDTIDLVSHQKKTIGKINAMKAFIKREETLGKDVFLTRKMLKLMEILDKANVEDMTIGQLNLIKSQFEDIKQLGKTKLKSVRDKFNLEKDFAEKRIVNSLNEKPLNDREYIIRKQGIDPEHGLKESFHNSLIGTHRWWQSANKAIVPTDTFFDMLGKDMGTYDDPVYYYFRELPNQNYFYGYIPEYSAFSKRQAAVTEKLNLTLPQKERVGIWMVLQENGGRGGRDRLKAMGYSEEELNLTLTAEEQEAALFARGELDVDKPEVQRLAQEIFEVEFSPIEEYFPMLRDNEISANKAIHERFGKQAPLVDVGAARSKKVNYDRLKKRTENAENPIRLNYEEVLRNYKQDIYYMKHMARDTKMLFEIVESQKKQPIFNPDGTPKIVNRGTVAKPDFGQQQLTFQEKAGTMGTRFSQEYVDLMARAGGIPPNHQRHEYIDYTTRNLSVAALGLKLASALIQPTALFSSAGLIGGRWVAIGVRDVIASKATRDYIMANFPRVRERSGGDISFLDRITDTAWERAKDKSYFALQFLDGQTAASAAWGSYVRQMRQAGKVIDLGKPPEMKFLKRAELEMTLTNSSGFWLEAPLALTRGLGIFQNRSLNRAILKFQSFMLFFWNAISKIGIRHGIRGKTMKQKKQGAWMLFWGLLIMPHAEGIIREGVDELEDFLAGNNEEEENTYWKDLAIRYVQIVPGLSQLTSVAVYSSTLFPIFKGHSDVAAGPIRVVTGKSASTRLKGAVDTVAGIGFMKGVPGTSQVQQYLKRVIDGVYGTGSADEASEFGDDFGGDDFGGDDFGGGDFGGGDF